MNNVLNMSSVLKKLPILSCAILACSSLALAKDHKIEELTDEKAIWVYEAYTELPTSAKKLAVFISADYANSSDEFEKHELLEKIKPLINKRVEKAKLSKSYKASFGISLSEYDFERNGFVTGVREGTFLPLGGRYACMFSDTKNVEFISMPPKEAKAMLKNIHKRQCVIEIVGEVQEVKDIALNGYMRKTVYIKPKKLLLLGGKRKDQVLVNLEF